MSVAENVGVNNSTQNVSTNGIFLNGTTAGSLPSECIILNYEDMEFIPWDNPDNVVSAEVEEMTSRVKDAVILPLLFLIGGPANVINMAVFYKQGLQERVNLCLFALSVADWLHLTQAMFLYGEELYLWATAQDRYGPVIVFMVNHNLLGLFGFTWVSQILSAILASERCLCVLCPLQSQRLLKTRTMAVLISLVYIVVVGLCFVIGARFRLVCVYDTVSDKAKMMFVASEFYHNHHTLIDVLNTFVFGAGIPVVVMVVVATTTTMTATKIRQAARWRSESSAQTISPREVALTKMLIGNSLLFMVCVFPIAVFRCVWLAVPGMNPGGRYHNLLLTSLWVLDVLTFVNSTFNFFVYYAMGSRFRDTLWALLSREKQKACCAPKR